MNQSKRVEDRGVDFVVDFVITLEAYFAGCYDRLVKKILKPGKGATLINDLLGFSTSGAEVFGNEAKAASFLGVGAVKKLVETIGGRKNRSKVVSLTQQCLQCKHQAETTRDNLIDAAVQIFASYERQFVAVTTKNDPSGELAMTKIAQDAANRLIHFYTEHECEITENSITQGLVQGNSKRYWNTYGLPKGHKGHKLLIGDQEINTNELFTTLGVIDGDYFYANIHATFPQDESIAFRRAFDWESVSSKHEFNKLSNPPNQQYLYMSQESLEEIRANAVAKIKETSPDGKYKQMLKELEDIAEKNAERLISEINSSHDIIQTYFNDMKTQLTGTSKEINKIDLKTTDILQTTSRAEQTNMEILEISKRTEEILKEVKDANEEVQGITQKTLDAVNNKCTDTDVPIRDWKRAVDTFTGRGKELDELDKKIHRKSAKTTLGSQITVITGLGGIGKTQLARKYTERNEKNYNDIIWLNAENKDNLIYSFCQLASKTQCRIDTNDKGEVIGVEGLIKKVYTKLAIRSEDKTCLIIFDNAEKSDYWDTFLPVSLGPQEAKNIKILLTSRDQGWKNILRFGESDDENGILKLGNWKPDEAMLFVKTYLTIASETVDNDLERLIRDLYYFPLALQKAVSYINEQNILSRVTVSDYMNLFRKKAESLLKFDAAYKEICDDYGKTTYTTWNITLDKILEDERHGQLAIAIMYVIAVIAPNNIFRSMFYDGKLIEDDVQTAVGLLVRYSMVNGENDRQEVLSVHRLVQRVLRLQLSGEHKLETYTKTVALFSKEDLWSGWMNEEIYRQRIELKPHMKMLRTHLRDELNERQGEDRKIIKELLLQVDLLLDELFETGYRVMGRMIVLGYGRESESWKWRKGIDEALELAEELHGEHSEEVAVILARIGKGLQRGLGKDLLIRALDIFSKLSSNRIEVGLAHVDLGYLWAFRYSCLDKGREHLRQGRAILEKHFSDNNERVVRALASIAFAFWAMCEYEEAKQLVQKSLKPLKDRGLEMTSSFTNYAKIENVRFTSDEGWWHKDRSAVDISKLKYVVLTIGDRERRCGSLRINLEMFDQNCKGNGQDNYPLFTLIPDIHSGKQKHHPRGYLDTSVPELSNLFEGKELVPTKSNIWHIFQIADLFDDEDSVSRLSAPMTKRIRQLLYFRWNTYHQFADLPWCRNVSKFYEKEKHNEEEV